MYPIITFSFLAFDVTKLGVIETEEKFRSLLDLLNTTGIVNN